MKKFYIFLLTALLGISMAQDKTGWPEVLRFGLLPREESTIDDQYGLFFEHLSSELGIPVEYFVGSDYAAIIVAMSTSRIEAGWFGPEAYVIATENSSAEAVALSNHVTNGDGYYSGIWTHKDSGITSIDDLKGKSFAFVDPASTSGYLVPVVHLLRDLELDINSFFGNVTFSGNHNASLLTLANQNVDGAAIHFSAVENAIKEGQIVEGELVNLWKSEKIPGSPIAVRGDLPESFKEAFKAAVLGFTDPAGLEKFSSLGFLATDDSNYDYVRVLSDVKEELEQ